MKSGKDDHFEKFCKRCSNKMLERPDFLAEFQSAKNIGKTSRIMV